MDYPIKMTTCDLCGRQYTDADGGCDCLADRFLCPECGAIQDADAPTFPKLRRAADGRRVGWIVCANCALCEACQDAPGTVLEECGIGTYWWICVQCANREA
jgi:hypothetical protein